MLFLPVRFRGLPFIQYLDDMPSLKRQVDGPFMMPIVDKWVYLIVFLFLCNKLNITNIPLDTMTWAP